MNSKEKSMIVEVLERIARIEERDKHFLETLREIKKSMEIINGEMGDLTNRIGKVENLYFEAKARYDRMSLWWKVTTFFLSPAITFGIICLVKYLLRLPVP